MSIVRWGSSSQMFLISEGMGKLFDEALEALRIDAGVPVLWSPPCDLFETASCYTLKAEVPGIGLDEIILQATGDTLTLAGERKKREDAQTVSYHRVERAGGRFIRLFQLSHKVDEERIEAYLKDGLLTVTLPKKIQHAVRKIEITG